MGYSNLLKYESESGSIGYIESIHIKSVDVSNSSINVSTNIGKTLSIQFDNQEDALSEAEKIIGRIIVANKVYKGEFILSKFKTTTV